ncbi:MAG: NAD kinase [Proteobacteria bacterium]|nr:NAD kinase [Pseudomonadota bacterium]
MIYKKIAIISSDNKAAIAKKAELIKQYGFIDNKAADFKKGDIDLIIALGGDGLMLHSLHEYQAFQAPIYGINYGTVGFLMNSLSEENLIDVIQKAEESILQPLKMVATDIHGKKHSYLAINEVSLLRQSNQAAKIKIEVNGKARISDLSADGILVCTSAGSTAYNLSVNGPIIPFGAKVIALTPISAFRPRNWRGALLPHSSKVRFTILEHDSRPVSAVADYSEVRDVVKVDVKRDRSKSFKILFDPNHSLEERIIREQFI